MSRSRNQFGELFKRFEAFSRNEPAPDNDIFIGESHEGTVIGLSHEPFQNLISFRRTPDTHQTQQNAGGATNTFESGKGKALDFAALN